MKVDEILGLLSKLMSVEKEEITNDESYYSEIYKFVHNNILEMIEDSDFSEKANVIYELECILNKMFFLSKLRPVLGKTVVGIFGTQRKEDYEFTKKFFSDKVNKMINNRVPMVIYGNTNYNVIAHNKFDNRVCLSEAEYILVNAQMKYYKIDIRSLIDLLEVGVDFNYGNIVYVYVPLLALNKTDEYINILDIFDCVCMCCTSIEDVRRIDRLREKYEGQIYVLPMNDSCMEDMLKYTENELNMSVISRYQIKNELYCNWNVYRNNFSFANNIYLQLLRVQAYIYGKIRVQETLISQMNSDLLGLDDEMTARVVREYRGNVLKEYELNKERYSKIKVNTAELIELVARYEKYLNREILGDIEDKQWDQLLYHDKYNQQCGVIAVTLAGMKELALASKYVKRLERRNYENMNLLLEYLRYVKEGNKVTESLKYAVKSADEDWLYDMILVLFYKDIGISNDIVAKRLLSKKSEFTKEEEYFLGEYFVDKNIGMAYQYFYKALKKGDISAGSRIMQLYEGKMNRQKLEELADRLVPEAAYILSKKISDSDLNRMRIFYLKIASVLGKVEAMRDISELDFRRVYKEVECQRLLKGIKRTIENEPVLKTIKNLIKSYECLEGIDRDNDYHRQLGVLYYLISDYNCAIQHLVRSKSSISHFLLGLIYESGYGVAVNLKKSLIEYDMAMPDIPEAEAHYVKVKGKLKEEKSAENIGNETVDTKYGKKSCYITTAICEALEKDDDCDELISLREYRDKVLIREKGGREIIEEYYRIAPTIVNQINDMPNQKEIYSTLYMKYIRPIVECLKRKEYQDVRREYVKMVNELKIYLS